MGIYDSQEAHAAYVKSVLGVKKGKKQSASNSLTDAVIKLFQVNGGNAWRINTMGIYDKEKGSYRTSGMKKGLPDVIGIYRGRFIGVEVKIGYDKQSEDQKKREVEINAAGGKYFIAKTFDQIKSDLDVNVFTT